MLFAFTFAGMSFQHFVQNRPTVDHLEHFDRDTALSIGMNPTTATAWQQLEKVYFGRTRHVKQQRKALNRAREGEFSVEQLAMIERRLKPITHEGTRWRLRLALLKASKRYKSLERAAKELIPAVKKPRKDSISFSKSVDGKRVLRIIFDERFLADLEAALRRGIDTSKPAGPQMLERFVALLRDGDSVPTASPTPLILVPLEDYVRILDGDGDETILGLTDGTTITGAECLQHLVGDTLQVALFHPEEGAVNLYTGQRHANWKQRILAKATSPVCLVPDCRHAADHCEVHHVVPWKHGGETNMNNLAMLCPYHNRTNDDDAHIKKRGRVRFIGGMPVWVSPRGYAVPNPYHQFGAMKLLFG